MAGLSGQQYAGLQNSAQNPTARVRQIPEKISELGCLAERLSGQAKNLEERLQSVLANKDEGDGGAKEPKPILVGHAEALDNIGSQLRDVAEFIDSILRRLEV